MQRKTNVTVKEYDVVVSVRYIEPFCAAGYQSSITFTLNESITRIGKVDDEFCMVETDKFTLKGGAVTANLSRNFNLLRLRTQTDKIGGYYHPVFVEALSGAKLQLHVTNHEEGEEYVDERGTTGYYENDCTTIEIVAIQLVPEHFRSAMIDIIIGKTNNVDVNAALNLSGNAELKVSDTSSREKMVDDIKKLAQASRIQKQAAATTATTATESSESSESEASN
jgi:hypothetical protein